MVRRMRSAEEQAYLDNVEMLLGSLRTLARALQGVEGRKQVLYFSAGFDARLLVGERGSEQRTSADSVVAGRLWEVDAFSRFGDSNLRQFLGEVTRALAAADTVVHSIDVTGLGSDRSLVQTSARQDTVRDTTNRESLGFLGAETDGRLFQGREQPRPRPRRDAGDDEPLLRARLSARGREGAGGLRPQDQGQGEPEKPEALPPDRATSSTSRLAGQTALQRPVRPRRARW